MHKWTSLLVAALVLNGAAACRERGGRAERQSASPDSSAPESTATAPPPAPRTPPALSPFPADKDTDRLKSRLAGSAGGVPTCGPGVPSITADSIGPFRPGISVAELARRCPGLLYGWVQISDGFPVPTVAARVGGASVTGFASDSSPEAIVNRIELFGRGPRTAEGIGVGSTLGDLQRLYGTPQASEPDCVLMVWFSTRPGLAFHLEYPPESHRECGALSEPPLPPELRVASVVLVQR